MATKELVIEQFQFLGIELSREILEKCISLCEEYEIDAESLSEQWMAFSVNRFGDASPTLEKLDEFVRKEFSKLTLNRLDAPAKETSRNATGKGKGLIVYAAKSSSQPENEVLSNYLSPNISKKIKLEQESAPVPIELQPATYSPISKSSAKYASRQNQGSVVHSFGDEALLEGLSKPNSSNDIVHFDVKQVPNDDGELYTKAMFGFELLHEKASTFDAHIKYVSQCIMKKNGLTDAVSVRHKSQNEVVVCGRVECDADARLNPKSVILQGTWEQSLSQAVPVDIDSLKQYSLFPGQVVVMRGVNPRGDRFIAREVFYDASQLVPNINIDDNVVTVVVMRGVNPRGDRFIAREVFCDASQPVPNINIDDNVVTGTLSVIAAAGPYTTSDNLSYEPLKDLVLYIATHKPHVVIMTGPFLDSEHAKVKDNSMAETFKSFFDKLMDSLGELNTSSPHTKIYILSSLKDAFHVNIYPTPPYSSRRKHPNLHFVPDPCTLRINGFVVAVTSTDVIMHISQEEIASGVGGDKLSRVSWQAAGQQCMYPLWPPPPTLPADAALWAAHAQLSLTPHLLVLPSNFRYFVKEVNGCVIVNPEHLTKGTGGGTFTRIALANDGNSPRIAAQILRI